MSLTLIVKIRTILSNEFSVNVLARQKTRSIRSNIDNGHRSKLSKSQRP
jgi:hypothetical protein